MKTHVITLSRIFPKGHICEGEATDFKQKVTDKVKIHTMRKPGKWAQRIKEVEEGKAVLSVREWTGVPYNSPQKELFQLTQKDGIGYEYAEVYDKYIILGGQNKPGKTRERSIEYVAKNDGLSLDDFHSWFRNVEEGTELIIIHFTQFRYL